MSVHIFTDYFLALRGSKNKIGMASGFSCFTGKVPYIHAFWINHFSGSIVCMDTAKTSLGDSMPMVVQSRTPPPSMMGLPTIPPSFAGYSYLLFKLGPLQLTRKGLSVASTSACLTFTIFQSASLCLTTTTPEQLAFALEWFMKPLAYVGVPVAEVILTLLLSLRFINLVFDEVRIVALGIVSRRINWQQLATMETVEVFFTYIRRIFKNIFNHAEQITQAMNVRGFRGDSKSHKIYFSSASSAVMANIVSVMTLVGLIGAAVLSEYTLS